jgi:small subunit ribosomal protein S7
MVKKRPRYKPRLKICFQSRENIWRSYKLFNKRRKKWLFINKYRAQFKVLRKKKKLKLKRLKNQKRKKIALDCRYSSELVTKMINYIMYNGKKSKAEYIVYSSLIKLSKKVKINAINAFNLALENIKPTVEVKARRIGGSTYQIPVEIRPNRQISLALKWLITASRKRKEKNGIIEKLSSELTDAYLKKGAAYKKKENMNKMAEANKAFSHFRF